VVTQNLYDKIRLFFQKDKEPFLLLKDILGFYPRDISFYRMALQHKSYAETNDKGAKVNNERLEFLGDAVLESVVSDIIYKQYPDKQEGFLTNLRSKLVKREMLNELAAKIGIDKLILHTGRITSAHNSYMGGNAFEALIGAIYLDRGYEYCKTFVANRLLKQHVNVEQLADSEQNFKSLLIEWCQKYQFEFQFVMTDEKVVNGVPTFEASVLVEGMELGEGKGYSKKESHQNAACVALDKVRNNNALVNKLVDLKRARRQSKNENRKKEN